MNIDFIAVLQDDYSILIYDVTSIDTELPLDIYEMSLDILSSKIPNGQITNKLDVVAYLRNQRIQKEIYTITSETLGFSTSMVIPDGVYHFIYTLNNNFTKENVFLVYNNVKKELDAMLSNVNYRVEVGDYDIEYVGDTCSADIEQVRLAVTLYDSLITQSQAPDEIAVNDTLDKLTRLLQIINDSVNV